MSKPQARVKDRMSALPDEIICHILSFLPTICAVRTSILSRRWKNLWTSVSSLDFDNVRDLCTKEKGCYGSDRFTTFVDRVFFFRDSSVIQKLHVILTHLHDFSRIDAWVCTAVRRNVVELDFCLYVDRHRTFELPQSLFMCKTLKVLKVSSNCITCAPPTSGCFPSLKLLHVTVMNPDKNSMDKLFSYCPVLEDLTIDGRIANGVVYNFKVFAPELKTLTINLDEHTSGHSFHINAPKLENLDLKQVALSNYNLQNSKFLVNASIVLRALSSEERASFPTRAIALLAVVSHVECLSLSAHCLEAWYLPLFHNLNQLKLVLHDCHYWDLLELLLDRSPKLKDLIVEVRTKCDEEYSVPQWNPPQSVPACMLKDLRTISIRGFRLQKVQKEVAKYLLKNGYVLDKMNWQHTSFTRNF